MKKDVSVNRVDLGGSVKYITQLLTYSNSKNLKENETNTSKFNDESVFFRLTLTIRSSYKQKDYTLPCVAFQDIAKKYINRCQNGDFVKIIGKLRQNTYVSRSKSKTSITIEEILPNVEQTYFNKVILRGQIYSLIRKRLTREKNDNSNVYATFMLSVWNGYSRRENWIECVIFGNIAETLVVNNKPGDFVELEGKVSTNPNNQMIIEKVPVIISKEEANYENMMFSGENSDFIQKKNYENENNKIGDKSNESVNSLDFSGDNDKDIFADNKLKKDDDESN